MYSQDIVSEHPERFFIGEIVREKIFMQYRNEVPYACQVYNSLVLEFRIPKKRDKFFWFFFFLLFYFYCDAQVVFYFTILQVNVVSYKARPNAKDFIQVEVVVEKNSQKIILIGKVSDFQFQNIVKILFRKWFCYIWWWSCWCCLQMEHLVKYEACKNFRLWCVIRFCLSSNHYRKERL